MFYTKKNLQINNFDTKKFNFLKLVEDHLKKNLNCDQVMDFHNYIPEDKMPKDIYEGTAHTYGHDLLYAIDPIFKQAKIIKASNIGFIELYKKFIKYLSEEIFKADIIFQKKPSLRIQYPNYTSYGKFHGDSDYNHPEEEINIWLFAIIGPLFFLISIYLNYFFYKKTKRLNKIIEFQNKQFTETNEVEFEEKKTNYLKILLIILLIILIFYLLETKK